MSFRIDENGRMELTQGDSGQFSIDGIPTDQNYKVYFAVQNSERVPIGNEIMVETNKQSSVAIKMTGNYTNLFVVDPDVKYATYYYGIKLCSEIDNTEDTLLIGTNPVFGQPNPIQVFPRKVEGI